MLDESAGAPHLSDEYADRVACWRVAGSPSIPLVIEADGLVHVHAIALPTFLGRGGPWLETLRDRARRYVDEHW